MTSITLSAFESALAFIVLLGGAAGVIYGALAFVSRRRVRISVSGSPEVIQEANDRAYEAFVMYVRSGREDPVLIEACGIVAQDTRGEYWRLGPGRPQTRVRVRAHRAAGIDNLVAANDGWPATSEPVAFVADPTGQTREPRPVPPPWWVRLLK